MTDVIAKTTASCAYCHVTGPAAHFEPINGQGNVACKQQNLCTVRGQLVDINPVDLVLQLVRELAQVARTDQAERHSVGHPGSPAWLDHAQAYRGMLSDQDLARLHVVLAAGADWFTRGDRAEWGQRLAQARTWNGCKRCGAMGPREPCRTADGGEAREWHAGRSF
jgi:hypothetical protein